ncbi:MAG: hypothetical protein RL141_1103 [Candidatus Parcubacteria bacterium]|jgi:hypothetical protein
MRHAFAQHSSKLALVTLGVIASFTAAWLALAADTSNFTQTISPGVLRVDIVNASSSYAAVGSPTMAMSPTTFSFNCVTSTGTFSSSTEAVYVENPDAADNGWSLSIAAAGGATAVWDSAGIDMDFNDPTTSGGCTTDGGDADSLAGRMQIDPTGILMATGTCGTCGTTALVRQAAGQFSQGVTDSITLIQAGSTSTDIGDWTFRNIVIRQSIPAQQAAGNDYDISMMLSMLAS